MTFKTALTAAVLAVLPGLALAQGCSTLHDTEQVMTCAEGTQWDAASGSCVEIITG